MQADEAVALKCTVREVDRIVARCVLLHAEFFGGLYVPRGEIERAKSKLRTS